MAITLVGSKRALPLLVSSAVGHMAFTPEQDREGLPRKLEELKRALHSTLLIIGWDLLNVTVFKSAWDREALGHVSHTHAYGRTRLMRSFPKPTALSQ